MKVIKLLVALIMIFFAHTVTWKYSHLFMPKGMQDHTDTPVFSKTLLFWTISARSMKEHFYGNIFTKDIPKSKNSSILWFSFL